MADINNFLKNVLAGDVQRTNRYRCLLDVGPLGLSEYGTAASLLREGLLCRTTITPSRSLETTTVDLSAGYEEKYAVYTTYTDIDCTFLCPLINGKTEVLSLFHAWQNRIQNHRKDGDMVLAFPGTYRLAKGMILELFSRGGGREVDSTATASNAAEVAALTEIGLTPADVGARGGVELISPSASFQYFNVYPLSVGGTTVDWVSDEMMEVSVTFSFTHWQQVV